MEHKYNHNWVTQNDREFLVLENVLQQCVSVPDASYWTPKASISTLYRHVENGRLRTLSIGGTMFIRFKDLEYWYFVKYGDTLRRVSTKTKDMF